MRFIADLHIHSKFSRATSPNMTVGSIAEYAELKGIKLMGTGDFTHPEWLSILKEKLKPTYNGLFTYRNTYFILSVEVNNTYVKDGRLRRVHNLIFSPSFDDVERINSYLGRFGNLKVDGRPTLSLDSKEMLEKILELSPESFLVPAHVWTPWFALFGANSGFDSMEECFGELKREIFALETGLSSDPPMNWRLSSLDPYTLISNSDAHSPAKIGREANVFDCELSFHGIRDTLKKKDKNRLLYTIEFFPQEGKYHYDGHRKCNVRLSPKESMTNNDICPVCGRPLTIGVMHRIELLSDREEKIIPENAIPYKHLVPLEEIIAKALNTGVHTVGVRNKYLSLVRELGGEFDVLLNAPLSEISKYSDERIEEGVERVREERLTIIPGYDGVFGTVKIFGEEKEQKAEQEEEEQMTLF